MSHSPGQLFSLSLVEVEDGLRRFSLSKDGLLIQQWWSPCNFWMAQAHAACSIGITSILDVYTEILPPPDELPVPGRFYCTFKVHKKHKHGEAPPPRGIVSFSGTLTSENIAIFVENNIKEIGKKN